MARSDDPESFLPLAATEYAVLLALADGEKHAYAILREVSSSSDGSATGIGLKVSASTLYSVVQRLERKGLIRESVERPDPSLDDQRRRYYLVTALGLAVARAETARLESMVSMARSGRLRERKV